MKAKSMSMKMKRTVVLSVLAALFAVLLTLVLLGKFAWGWFDEQASEPYVAPTLEDGEAYYYLGTSQIKDVVLMYPQLSRSDLSQIRIHNAKGENYFFFHVQTESLNYFALGESASDTWDFSTDDLYYPPILDSYVGTFDYTSLYDDTSTMPTMLAAVGMVIIDERIKPTEGELTESGQLTQAFLARYGLSTADDPAYFELVTYLRDGRGNYLYIPIGDTDSLVGYDEDDGKYYYITSEGTRGEEYTQGLSTLTPAVDTSATKRVYVGNQTVDDTGYYLYLEGRNTIYTTQSSYLDDVVGRSLGYYISPRLVTASESAYANQLTPSFSLSNGNYSDSPYTVVKAGMTVGFTTDTVWIVDSDVNGNVKYYRQFSVKELQADSGVQDAFRDALAGKYVGDSVDILLTTPKLSDIGKTETYYILKVDGIFTDDGYDTTEGRTVQAGDRIIISYVDATASATNGIVTQKGYVDLGDESLPSDFKALFIGLTTGEEHSMSGSDKIVYTKTYDGTDTELYHVTVAIEKIESVYDADGNELSGVAYGSYVTMTYLFYEDGEVVGEYTSTLVLPASAEEFADDDKWVALGYASGEVYTMRTLLGSLIGKGTGEYLDADGRSDLTVDIPYPTEYISDFTMYQGAQINFVTSYEEILTFRYTNDRDVYYGSSLYEILSPSDKTLYALDANATLEVLRKFEDLTGDETVAVGLTAEVMREYGLYAYKLYYELPFDCYTIDKDDNTYYYYKSSIGFTLYISEVQKDGSRYVGSDQYDIVVKVTDGSTFDFVEWDFSTRWMQNNLLLVSYENLRGMVFDLNFAEEEYNHIWGFDISVDPSYPYTTEYYQNGELQTSYEYLAKLYASLVDGGEHTGNLTYEELRSIFDYTYTTDTTDYTNLPYNAQTHTAAGRYIHTVSDTLRYITELANGTDLDSIYNYQNTYETSNYDGSYCLRRLLQMLNSTCYWGTAASDLTDDEMQALLEGEDTCTMTLALTLVDDDGKLYGYTMRFYNYSGHSLVSITDERSGGQESHLFYVQAREVNKIAKIVVALTKGESFDMDAY